MSIIFLLAVAQSIEMNSTTSYVIGFIIALFILGYLLYALIKPEKF